MKLIDKNLIVQKIGKENLWKPVRNLAMCEYIAGVTEVDEKIGSQNFMKSKPIINFIKHPNGLSVEFLINFKFSHTAISNTELLSVIIEKGNIIDTEKRSIVGRAIVGGLLLGPFGALIGGASGMKDKVIKENDNLIITAKIGDKESALLFSIKKGKTKDVYNFFKTNFTSVFSFVE